MFYLTDLKNFNILILILDISVESVPREGTHKLLDAGKLMSSLQMANSWSQNISDKNNKLNLYVSSWC